MGGFHTIFAQDMRVARSEAGGVLLAVQFFAMGALIFPLGLGPSPALLGRVGGGLLAVMALFAALLALDRLFSHDQEDGSLDVLLTSGLPLWNVVLAKVSAHWLLTAAPIILAAPVLCVLLQMGPSAIWGLTLALLLGTPTLSLIGAVGASGRHHRPRRPSPSGSMNERTRITIADDHPIFRTGDWVEAKVIAGVFVF